MFDELVHDEVDQYLVGNPRIVPLFEIDLSEVVIPYITDKEDDDAKLDQEAVRDLRQAHEALEKELGVSQCVKASTLEEVNLGTVEEPRPVSLDKEM